MTNIMINFQYYTGMAGYKRLEINKLDQNKLEFTKLEAGYSTYVRNSKKSLIIKLG